MYISKETPAQTEERLLEVLKTSSFKLFEQPYCFREFAEQDSDSNEACLTMAKDDEVWSYLVPAQTSETENFKIFRFHFKDGLDNSGFVGWLASKIKDEFGSGVFVVCGQNSKKGGIFDYWGIPISIGDEVVDYVLRLRDST